MKFFCIPLFTCRHGIVESLDYSQLRLEELPKDIMKSRKYIEELFLNTNIIEELPPEFFRCTKLRKLDVTENKIKVLPAEIGALQSLSELYLSKNEFVELPEEIGDCLMLSVLNISTNIVPKLPKSIINLSMLTHLNVSDNPLTQLPSDINLLTALQYLDASQCELRFLPPNIVHLANLKMLDVCENYLIELPKGMDGMVSLEILDLHSNAIAHLPEELLHCQALKSLDLNTNHLTQLPVELGDLKNLTELYICDNQLTILPSSIGQMKKLETLKAAKNCLQELTPAVSSCELLTDLILSENQLYELPSSLGNLKHLKFLDLNVNNLRSLPTTIGGCSALTILNLRHNQLLDLPMEIGRLSNLRVLDVIDNNLTYLPYTVTVLYQCRLSALLLSFTQPSLPKLSVTNEPVTNVRVLTCYLLPQRGENPNDLVETKPRSCVGGARVCFANDGISTIGNGSADDEEEKLPLGRFERYDTPHPKPFAPKNIANRNSIDLTNVTSTKAAAGIKIVENQEEKSVKSQTPREPIEIRPLRSVLKRPRTSMLLQDENPANDAVDTTKNKSSEMSTNNSDNNNEEDSNFVGINRASSAASTEIGGEIVAITISGGVNSTLPGFTVDQKPGSNSPPRIVTIAPDSAAARSGKLRVGDRLLTVNGINVKNNTCQDVMSLLSSNPNADTYLVVERRPFSSLSVREPAPFPPTGLSHARSLPSLMQPLTTSSLSPPPIPPRTFNRNNSSNFKPQRSIAQIPNRSMGCLFDPAVLERLHMPTSIAPSRIVDTSVFSPVNNIEKSQQKRREFYEDAVNYQNENYKAANDKLAGMMDFDKPLATSSPIPHESRTASHIPLPLSGSMKSTTSVGHPSTSMEDSRKSAATSKILPPPVAPKPKLNPERLNFSSKLQRFEEEIHAQRNSRSILNSSGVSVTQSSSSSLLPLGNGALSSSMRRSCIPTKKPLVTSDDLEKLRAEAARRQRETVNIEENAEVVDSVGELLTNDACFNQIIAGGRIGPNRTGPAVVRKRNAEVRAEKAHVLTAGRYDSPSFMSDEPSNASLTQLPDEASLLRTSSSMSSLEQRVADLEKRQAWRQARLKSMDVESQRTDDVLKLITSIPPSPIPIK